MMLSLNHLQEEIRLGPSNSPDDCDGRCFECQSAYMSDDPDNVYHFCEEDRPVRFSNICKPNKKWSDERCNAEGHCLRSYVFGDPGKFRGEHSYLQNCTF